MSDPQTEKIVIHAFFNNWFPATRAEMARCTNEELHARAIEHFPLTEGYRDGDPLLKSEYPPVEFDVVVVEGIPAAGEIERACGFVFAEMNRDSRCNGQTERSLSVGDILAILYSNGEYDCYEVSALGFTNLAAPPEIVLAFGY